MIVDTHTHTWGEDTAELPWEAEILPKGWTGPYTHRDLADDNDANGVDASVVVSTPLYGAGPRANEYTMRSIEAHPDRFYGVGLMDYSLDPTDDLLAAFRRVVGHERMLGVRLHALSNDPTALAGPENTGVELDPTSEWFLDDRYAPLWAEAVRQETPIFVFMNPRQLPFLDELAAANPALRIVVDHAGWPDETAGPDAPPWNALATTAEYDNVYVKVSALARFSGEGWPYGDVLPYVRNLVEWFGSDRLLWGSDYPSITGYGATYEETVSWVDEAAFLSARDRRWLFHRTFERLHRL